mgnify:CR=1 FL=1
MYRKSMILVICATILVLSFVVGSASARTWSVDGSGGGDFSAI